MEPVNHIIHFHSYETVRFNTQAQQPIVPLTILHVKSSDQKQTMRSSAPFHNHPIAVFQKKENTVSERTQGILDSESLIRIEDTNPISDTSKTVLYYNETPLQKRILRNGRWSLSAGNTGSALLVKRDSTHPWYSIAEWTGDPPYVFLVIIINHACLY